MHKEGYYSSGEFAKKANVTVRTIRYYDKQNILKPSLLTEDGVRFYTDSDFTRLQQILLFKYLGFSLEDIRNMTIGDSDYNILLNSLNLQFKLIQDKIAQMELVKNAIEDTIDTFKNNKSVDWSNMLLLIHLTNMESTLKTQYLNAGNITARINLHAEYSVNKQGWFNWIYEQSNIQTGQRILEIGCGDGRLWVDNKNNVRKLSGLQVFLSDISDGMVNDARRNIEAEYANESGIEDTLQGTQNIRDIQNTWEMQNTRDIQHIQDIQDSTAHKTGQQVSFKFNTFDCADIPYKNNYFDIVLANHVLFYCDNIENVLKEVKRVLKPGGVFICATYGAFHMKEISELVTEFDKRIVLAADNLYDKFGLDNGRDMLIKHFNNVDIRKYDDYLLVDKAEPLIEYILSCHGNQNQYLLDRYSDFKAFIRNKLARKPFKITKDAGLFICKDIW